MPHRDGGRLNQARQSFKRLAKPRDLLIAEARYLGVPLLPLDVQKSDLEYRVEPLPDGRLGVRVALTEVIGSSEQERARIVRHRPFTSLQDFRDRVRPCRRIFDALARVGALDGFIEYQPRRRHELLAHIRRVEARPQKVADTQLAFDFDLPVPRLEGVTALDLHGRRQSDLEMQELGVAISGHRMNRFHQLFADLGVTPARSLLDLPTGTDVLIAGVRRATNTPPIRGGGRVVFVSLDDSTGISNVVFFADAQARIKEKTFRTAYLLVRGTTRRSGARGISVTGHEAWDLLDVQREREQRTRHNEQPIIGGKRTA